MADKNNEKSNLVTLQMLIDAKNNNDLFATLIYRMVIRMTIKTLRRNLYHYGVESDGNIVGNTSAADTILGIGNDYIDSAFVEVYRWITTGNGRGILDGHHNDDDLYKQTKTIVQRTVNRCWRKIFNIPKLSTKRLDDLLRQFAKDHRISVDWTAENGKVGGYFSEPELRFDQKEALVKGLKGELKRLRGIRSIEDYDDADLKHDLINELYDIAYPSMLYIDHPISGSDDEEENSTIDVPSSTDDPDNLSSSTIQDWCAVIAKLDGKTIRNSYVVLYATLAKNIGGYSYYECTSMINGSLSPKELYGKMLTLIEKSKCFSPLDLMQIEKLMRADTRVYEGVTPVRIANWKESLFKRVKKRGES